MTNLILLEWNKLKKGSIIAEVIIYILSAMGIAFLFLLFIDFGFNKSYTATIDFLNLLQRTTFTLFGASLIAQVVIHEYKTKTITIVFTYPIQREKILLAKILLMAFCLFFTSIVSYIAIGGAIYITDSLFQIIVGIPTVADLTKFVMDMIVQSLALVFISLIPLFYFAIVKKSTITTVIFSIVIMQLQNATVIFNFDSEWLVLGLVILGLLSILLSLSTFERFGKIS